MLGHARRPPRRAGSCRFRPRPETPRRASVSLPALACAQLSFEVRRVRRSRPTSGPRATACHVAFGNDAVVGDETFDALDGFRRPGLQFERVADERVRSPPTRRRFRARRGCTAARPGWRRSRRRRPGRYRDRPVRGERRPGRRCRNRSVAAYPLAEGGHSRVMSRPACTARCTSFSWAVGWPNTASSPSPLVEPMWPSYRSTIRRDVVAVTPDHGAIDLRLDAGGQCGGIHQIGEQDRKATDLAAVDRGPPAVLRRRVVAVDGQHLPGEEVGSRAITFGGGAQCAIEQPRSTPVGRSGWLTVK